MKTRNNSTILELENYECVDWYAGFPKLIKGIALTPPSNFDTKTQIKIGSSLYEYNIKLKSYVVDNLDNLLVKYINKPNLDNWTFTKIDDDKFILKPPGILEVRDNDIKYEYLDSDHAYNLGFVDKIFKLPVSGIKNPLFYCENSGGFPVSKKNRENIILECFNS